MQPGLSRAFSTTRRIAQQPLFEPYVPVLNEEQKKALRKVARQNEPHYHGHMKRDALFILKAHSRTESQKVLLKETHERLKAIVKQHGGPSCSVEDIGMHRYSRSIHDAPFEFAIVDKTRPNGVSPDEDSTKLPIVYDASRFAEILMQEGFTGGFWAPPWDMGSLHQSFVTTKFSTPAERDLTMSWPRYRRPSLREFQYPVRMVTYSPIAFSLTLPGPTVIPLHEFIKSYFRYRSSLNPLMALLFIWTRSHRMDEFTTQTLALMIIRFMQERGKVPNILEPDHPRHKRPDIKTPSKSTIWVPFQYTVEHNEGVDTNNPREWRVEPNQLEYTMIKNPASITDNSPRPASLFWDFIHFWRSGIAISRTFALSPGENKYLKRRIPPLQGRQYEQDISHIFQLTEQAAKADGFDPTSTTYDPRFQSFSWRLQALIVQDPFIPTYNHAESVSRETLHCFVRRAQMTSRQVSHAWPFATAFGEYFVPSPADKANMLRRKRTLTKSRRYHADAAGAKRANRPEITDPPKPVLAARARTIKRVQNAIRKKYGKKYRVQAFGSTAYGVSTAKSDLDLVVIDSARMNGFPPDTQLTGLPDIYNVKKLSRVLGTAGFTKIEAIAKASVPIVKFTDNATGLACDINVNEQLGLLNTGMIRRYCDIVPILRPMVAFIKRWAKPLGLNSPSIKGGPQTFSSYALMLMTISYLQSKGLAPNLQCGLKPQPDASGYFWARKVSKRGSAARIPCDTRYHLGHGWAPKEMVSYENALAGWFRYWGNEHSYSTSIASIRHGGFVLKDLETEDTPTPIVEPGKHRQQHEGSLDDIPHRLCTVQDSCGVVNNTRSVEQTIQTQDGPPSSIPHVVTENTENTVAQKLVTDRGASETHPILRIHDLLVTDGAPDFTTVDGVSTSFDEVEEAIISNSPPLRFRVPKRPPKQRAYLFPLCVVDPFLRRKIVTQAISHGILDQFQLNCQWTAKMLSWGASLEEVVSVKKGKISKKLPKLPPLPAHLRSNRSSAVSEIQENQGVQPYVMLTKVHAAFTPQTTKRYPGAVACGPDEQAPSGWDIFGDDILEEVEVSPGQDAVLGPPRRLLPEFEPEGFGLKAQSFEEAKSSIDDPEKSMERSIGFDRLEQLDINDVIHPRREAEVESDGSRGDLGS